MRRRVVRAFLLADIMAAFALLLVLGVAFVSSLRVIDRMSAMVSAERRAYGVLDNTLERLSRKASFDSKLARMIFMDEFKSSGLEAGGLFIPGFSYVPESGKACLELRRADGRVLTSVELECRL